jgi:hypothetical protein
MVAFLSELSGLDLWATDIGNAYLEAKTSELLFIIASPEFGDLEGHMLIIYKALYGLFVPQAYAGMNASPHVFETWASSLARPNQISG